MMFWKRGWISSTLFDGCHYSRIWVGERSDGSVFWQGLIAEGLDGKLGCYSRLDAHMIKRHLIAPTKPSSFGCFDECCAKVRATIFSDLAEAIGAASALYLEQSMVRS